MALILASASPRRSELLKTAGFNFTVCVGECDESIEPGMTPEETVMSLAQKKAGCVAPMHCGDTVLGADTVVVAPDGRILGKPHDSADAEKMLRALSGKVHTVLTGVCIIKGNSVKTFCECTRVEFYELDDALICEYIQTGEPFDKAGAYGIQGRGCVLVRRIEGDYFNVVGLPVSRVARELNII